MEPKIISRDAFTVMGVQERFTPGNEDYDAIWMKRFMSYHDQVQPLSTDKAYYGVSFETGIADTWDYVAGMAVANVGKAPQGLVMREVPPAREAVFQCTVKTIGETFDYIFKEWLPASPYEHDPSSSVFEYYPPDTATSDSPVFLHIPIREKRK